MMRSLVVFCLCLVAVASTTSCSATTLIEPAPQSYSDPVPNMRESVIRGMQRRGWRTMHEDKGAGVIRARLVNRGHTGTVQIQYSDTGYSIKHVESTGLKEARDDNGNITIHKSYNTWLQNLAFDIDDEIRLSQMNASMSSGE